VIREEPVAGTADRFRFAGLRGLIGFGKSFAGLFFEQVPIPRSTSSYASGNRLARTSLPKMKKRERSLPLPRYNFLCKLLYTNYSGSANQDF